MENNKIHERIMELETELVMLRAKTRIIDFEKDYIRSCYKYHSQYSSSELEKYIYEILEIEPKPIEHSELIHKIIQKLPLIHERDFEKTNSGSIRIFSNIRVAVVKMKNNKVITMPERGRLMLTQNFKK